jgi:hypothetical protein
MLAPNRVGLAVQKRVFWEEHIGAGSDVAGCGGAGEVSGGNDVDNRGGSGMPMGRMWGGWAVRTTLTSLPRDTSARSCSSSSSSSSSRNDVEFDAFLS